MAKDDEKLIIEVELDDGKLAKGFVKAEEVAKKSGRKSGKGFGDAATSSAESSLDNLESRLLGLGALLAGGLGAGAAIEASSRQQKAVNSLETSLKSLGQYTPTLSRELQDYASALQASTKYGDEATLEQLAFAQAMGASVEQSKEIVAAAQDMASRLGIDFNSAVRNISKTLGGFAGELGEVIPELKALSQEQLQNGEGVTLLANKYKGFANSELQDFDTKLEQTKNTFGDFSEVLGDFVTKSEASVGFMDDMGFALTGLTKTLKEFMDQDTTTLDQRIANTRNEIKSIQDIINNEKTRDKSWVDSLLGGPDIDHLNEKLKRLNAEMKAMEKQREVMTNRSKNNPVVDNKEIEGIRSAEEEYDKLIKKYTDLGYSAELAKTIISDPAWQENIIASNRELSLSFSDLSKSLRAEAGKIKITSGQIANTMIQGIGNGAGQAFAAFGKALAEGENGLEALLNSFLASMGQMAVQVGTQFILQGVGYQLAGMPNGGPLIAAGAALAAFGGAMGAIGSKGEGGSTSTASSGYSIDPGGEIDRYDNDDSVLDEEAVERRADTQVINNFNGTFLDSNESGVKIVEMINNATKEQGAVLA